MSYKFTMFAVQSIELMCVMHMYTDGLVQDCNISIANALEILQSCIKSSICTPGLNVLYECEWCW